MCSDAPKTEYFHNIINALQKIFKEYRFIILILPIVTYHHRAAVLQGYSILILNLNSHAAAAAAAVASTNR